MCFIDFWLIFLAWQDMVTRDSTIHNISFVFQMYINHRFDKLDFWLFKGPNQ